MSSSLKTHFEGQYSLILRPFDDEDLCPQRGEDLLRTISEGEAGQEHALIAALKRFRDKFPDQYPKIDPEIFRHTAAVLACCGNQKDLSELKKMAKGITSLTRAFRNGAALGKEVRQQSFSGVAPDGPDQASFTPTVQ